MVFIGLDGQKIKWDIGGGVTTILDQNGRLLAKMVGKQMPFGLNRWIVEDIEYNSSYHKSLIFTRVFSFMNKTLKSTHSSFSTSIKVRRVLTVHMRQWQIDALPRRPMA